MPRLPLTGALAISRPASVELDYTNFFVRCSIARTPALVPRPVCVGQSLRSVCLEENFHPSYKDSVEATVAGPAERFTQNQWKSESRQVHTEAFTDIRRTFRGDCAGCKHSATFPSTLNSARVRAGRLSDDRRLGFCLWEPCGNESTSPFIARMGCSVKTRSK